MKLLKIFFFVILSFILSSYALSQTTIGYIDLDRLVKDSKYGKELITELEKIRINDIKNLKSEKNEIIKYENNLKNKKNILSNDELKKEIKKLEENYLVFKRNENEIKQKFEKKKNNELTNFFNKINPLIEDYMKINLIDILIDKKDVFIGMSKYDITDDIIKIINKNYE
jgi:outer membrane protein